MNTKLLREWLNLPPGAWPPADRELLGFNATEPVDSNTVEIRALERMDLLRTRQLIEPDLVTEGMNRLAQAMIALTSASPAKPVEPIKKAKKPAREKTPVEIRKPAEVKLDLGGPKPATPLTSTTQLTPAVLEAEVLEVAADANVIPESIAVVADDKVADVLLEPIVIPEPPPGTVIPPSPRRKGYKAIAQLRRLRDEWTQFRPILGDPSEKLQTPARITTYLSTISSLRSQLRTPIETAEPFPQENGRLVLRVVFDPTPLALLRDLVPSQRVALARDWAVAEAELNAKIKRVRKSLRRERPNSSIRKGLRSFFRILSANPEWVLIVVIVASLIVGYVRRGRIDTP